MVLYHCAKADHYDTRQCGLLVLVWGVCWACVRTRKPVLLWLVPARNPATTFYSHSTMLHIRTSLPNLAYPRAPVSLLWFPFGCLCSSCPCNGLHFLCNYVATPVLLPTSPLYITRHFQLALAFTIPLLYPRFDSTLFCLFKFGNFRSGSWSLSKFSLLLWSCVYIFLRFRWVFRLKATLCARLSLINLKSGFKPIIDLGGQGLICLNGVHRCLSCDDDLTQSSKDLNGWW